MPDATCAKSFSGSASKKSVRSPVSRTIMKARKVFETMEKGFGPAISILMLVDLGKDIYEYTKDKVQTRRQRRTSNLTPAGAH